MSSTAAEDIGFGIEVPPPGVVYPAAANLRRDVYRPLPRVAPGTIIGSDPATETTPPTAAAAAVPAANDVLDALNAALAAGDAAALAALFDDGQCFWRDMVALTGHLRTLRDPPVVAAALLHLHGRRGVRGSVEAAGDAQLAVAKDDLMFIDCPIAFETTTPAQRCAGRLLLLPVRADDGVLSWKIWVLSTWVAQLVDHPEDESLLERPARTLDGLENIETDVVIVGAGSSGQMMAARLKALGAESIIIERNAGVGDNWRNRYDCVKFHVPTTACELPYLDYRKEKQSPHRLTKYDVAEYLEEYAERCRLSILFSATIKSTVYNAAAEQKWTVKVETPSGPKIIVAKHFVQTTGIGSGKPFVPAIPNRELFKGISIHSTQYRNGRELAAQGVKTVAVIGSANTAFDVMQDCHDAGLATTMVARSPTYVLPLEYSMRPYGLGAWTRPRPDARDTILLGMPQALGGQLAHLSLAQFAAEEPDRYTPLRQAGFPAVDSLDPDADTQHNLIERAGGHYVDAGATRLLASGRVAVRGGAHPVAWISPAAGGKGGLSMSDGRDLEGLDAVVWCTGFDDRDVRGTATDILGGDHRPLEELLDGMPHLSNGNRLSNGNHVSNGDHHPSNGDHYHPLPPNGKPATLVNDHHHKVEEEEEEKEKEKQKKNPNPKPNLLGPRQIADRLDATFGVDGEGEVRGVGKRHLRVDNYWVIGGIMAWQRWLAWPTALQIRLALDGALPPAYRGTPKVN
ncbi:hypothetical protein GGR56DRAFT_164706 [Xylariaceae sp. FL0804]|nr:hypothetical protein GGR56DRAFT_164706 [Xylariaceae sp. FL0804]